MVYEYNGYVPYGAGECFLVCQWTDNHFDGNATENAIKNGCRFEIVDKKNAFLIPPAGGVKKIQFVRIGVTPFPMEEQPDGSFLVR